MTALHDPAAWPLRDPISREVFSVKRLCYPQVTGRYVNVTFAVNSPRLGRVANPEAS